jgi:hypothetical protein
LAGFEFVENPAGVWDPKALVVRVPAGIRSKEKLFAVLADKLRFPRYFGWNWDAVEECLRDLSWLAAGRSVVIVHQDLPFGAGGENRQMYLDLLRSAVQHGASDGGRSVQVIWPAALQEQISPSATGRP